MALHTQLRAMFYDEKGVFHGKKVFSKHDKTFKYGKGMYNVDLKNGSEYEYRVIPVILKRREFIYNIAFSNPLDLKQPTKKEVEEYCKTMNKTQYQKESLLVMPNIDPELYDINMETKVAQDLNNLARKGLKINWKVVLLCIAGLAIIWYFASGHTLSQLTGASKFFLPMIK